MGHKFRIPNTLFTRRVELLTISCRSKCSIVSFMQWMFWTIINSFRQTRRRKLNTKKCVFIRHIPAHALKLDTNGTSFRFIFYLVSFPVIFYSFTLLLCYLTHFLHPYLSPIFCIYRSSGHIAHISTLTTETMHTKNKLFTYVKIARSNSITIGPGCASLSLRCCPVSHNVFRMHSFPLLPCLVSEPIASIKIPKM